MLASCMHQQNPTKRASLILGSLQAACNLKEIDDSFGRSVNVVVTMCKDEMKVAGTPSDWSTYFQENNAMQLQCQLDDITVKQPRCAPNENKAMRQACLQRVEAVCGQLWKISITAVLEETSMHILFHCFGGINHSAAILCAWLIVAYDYTAEEAINLLLRKRPSLRPWRHRSYVLDALYCVNLEKVEWRAEFSTSHSQTLWMPCCEWQSRRRMWLLLQSQMQYLSAAAWVCAE